MDYQNPKHLLAAAKKIREKFHENTFRASMSAQQQETIRDDPVIGPLWVSKFTTPKPTVDTSRDALLQLVDEGNTRQVHWDRPESAPLKFEWVGYRSNVKKDTPEPFISEKEKFENLSAESKNPLTVLYIYGGFFAQNTPSCYRKLAANLSRATEAKVLMVEQRLAPTNPFPAALLDVFQAYLTLINPPPGSPHKPIPASSIVIAGDSAGGCLALGILQVILQLQRKETSIKFHGATINFSSNSPIIPSGLALLSPVAEIVGALPSFLRNAHMDIYPIPMEKLPYLEKRFPTCDIWPANPPRANVYCEAGMLAHPLVSPVVAEDWTGSCPIWIGMGEEQTQDCSRLLAQEMHRAGVSVTLREYECMIHSFFMIHPAAPQSKQLLEKWIQAMMQFGKGERPESSACFVMARGLKEESLDLDHLVDFSMEEARRLVWEKTRDYKVPAFHREGGGSNL